MLKCFICTVVVTPEYHVLVLVVAVVVVNIQHEIVGQPFSSPSWLRKASGLQRTPIFRRRRRQRQRSVTKPLLPKDLGSKRLVCIMSGTRYSSKLRVS